MLNEAITCISLSEGISGNVDTLPSLSSRSHWPLFPFLGVLIRWYHTGIYSVFSNHGGSSIYFLKLIESGVKLLFSGCCVQYVLCVLVVSTPFFGLHLSFSVHVNNSFGVYTLDVWDNECFSPIVNKQMKNQRVRYTD